MRSGDVHGLDHLEGAGIGADFIVGALAGSADAAIGEQLRTKPRRNKMGSKPSPTGAWPEKNVVRSRPHGISQSISTFCSAISSVSL